MARKRAVPRRLCLEDRVAQSWDTSVLEHNIQEEEEEEEEGRVKRWKKNTTMDTSSQSQQSFIPLSGPRASFERWKTIVAEGESVEVGRLDVSLLHHVEHVDPSTDEMWVEIRKAEVSCDPTPCRVVDRGRTEIGWGHVHANATVVHAIACLCACGFVAVAPLGGGDSREQGSVSVRLTRRTFENGPEEPHDTTERRHHPFLRTMLDFFFPAVAVVGGRLGAHQGRPDTRIDHSAFDPRRFYAAILPDNNAFRSLSFTQDDNLLPTLRPYQCRAATWMVFREQRSGDMRTGAPHPLWIECRGVDGKVFGVNGMTGQVTTEYFEEVDGILGGILADEMGLGKTVEVLACLFAHQHPQHNELRAASMSRIAQQQKGQGDDFIACICGNRDPPHNDDDNCLWVQCDMCGVWQHAACVGFVQEEEEEKEEEEEEEEEEKERPFFCSPECADRAVHVSYPVVSGATLIVCPSLILHQWREEIERHVRKGSLRVHVYHGVKHGDSVTAYELAACDVVLTSYDVLRTDVHHIDPETKRRNLRFHKRYKVTPTPLTGVLWWRVCLDEAQMVESTTAAAAEMALELPAIYRWCVTGTPIQRGLEDLYGLLLFLGVEPYSKRSWWNRALQMPYERGDPAAQRRMHSLFRRIMWRNDKESVADELALPEQTHGTRMLHFSAVEAYFYRKQHDKCAEAVHRVLQKASDGQSPTLQRHIVAKAFHPLLRLRQACCHPQVGRHGVHSVQRTHLTMDELLQQLINNAKVDCEEAQRLVLMAINGLAALHILKAQMDEGAELYRTSLRLMESNEREFRADDLQKLHVFHNLWSLVKQGTITGRTLRDDSFPREAEEIRRKYIAEACTKVKVLEEQWHLSREEASQKIFALAKEEGGVWWIRALAQIGRSGEFTERVRSALVEGETVGRRENTSSIARRFQDMTGLRYVLATEIDKLYTSRTEAVAQFSELCHEPTKEDVEISANCGQCKSYFERTGLTCPHCRVEKIVKAYENRLFHLRTEHTNLMEGMGVDREWEEAVLPFGSAFDRNEAPLDREERRRGRAQRVLRAPSEVERVLRMLATAVRTEDRSLYQEAMDGLKVYDLLREEFKRISLLWMAQKEQLSRLDELDMAMHRIRFQLPNEVVPPSERNFIIRPIDVDAQIMKLTSDRGSAEAGLRGSQSQLHYLQSLAAARGSRENEERGECAICHETLGRDVVILLCGHTFCYQCIMKMVERSITGNIKCPTCRSCVHVSGISYVSEQREEDEVIPLDPDERDGIYVKGSYGTKIEAVVRSLLVLKRKTPDAKSLVFSQWKDVLDLIARALNENGISFVRINGIRSVHHALHKFQTDPSIHVLLLPVQSGGNGLNLVEATHVFMIEPLLNPAMEEQAINRVHRIGQTRPTHVHRFVVVNTIEERVHAIGRKKAERSSSNWKHKQREKDILTVEDISSLFVGTSSRS